MDTIGYITPVIGILLLVGSAITAAHSLLFRAVEVKRVVTFAGILIFCGVFLILFERITLLELPGNLGKITIQAKEDAKEIRDIRVKVEAQGKAVTDIVANVNATAGQVSALTANMEAQQQTVTQVVTDTEKTANRITFLANEIERKFSRLWELQFKGRKQSLLNYLEIVDREIRFLTEEIKGLSEFHNNEEFHKIKRQITNLEKKQARLLHEMELLETEEQSLPIAQQPGE